MKFNGVAYYFSQYFWIIYVLIPLIVGLFVPKKSKTVTINSSTSKFDKTKDPVLFAHLSDTHLNTLRPASIEVFHRTVLLVQSYLPEFIIHTGDIVDNYDSTKFPRFGVQSEGNWRAYREEIKNIVDIPIIEVGGNHDMFGIKAPLSKGNYIADSSQSFNRNVISSDDEFYVRSFRVGPSKTNIIAFNPFYFPTPHAPLMMIVTVSKRVLDLIEKEIEKSDTKSIIISHFPTGSINSKKSSKGRSFTDIIDSKETVIGYLTGHWHPRTPSTFSHKNGGIELIGTAGFARMRSGLVTIDNDGLSWSILDINDPPKGVISYPIPKKQLSSNAIFNDKEETEIRVVMFSSRNDLRIEFNIIDSDTSKTVFNGYLRYNRPLINSHTLYTFPMNECIEKFGSYNITFSGDFDGNSSFIVNDHYVMEGSRVGYFTNLYKCLPASIAIFILVHFIITFPIRLNFFDFQTKLDEIEKWIETPNGVCKARYWLFSIFLGFLIARSRFLNTPLFVRIFGFFCLVFSFLGPLVFFKSEGVLGFAWIYGYVSNGKALPSDYGMVYSIFYLAATVSPIVLVSSNLGVVAWSPWQVADFVVGLGCVVGDVLIIIRIVYESAGNLSAASFAFVIIPFAYIVVLIAWLILARMKKKCGNGGINENSETSVSSEQKTSTSP